MRILFDGPVPVDYGQIYLTSRELPDMGKAFAGQVNGLCGAGEPGKLFLITGTRRIAVWAARHAFAFAGVADLDWMAPAWAAVERGGPLPAEFADPVALWARITGEQPPALSFVALNKIGPGPADPIRAALDGPVDPIAMAVPALAAAALPDPLRAALEALWAAVTAYADRRAVFLAEVRRTFPVVDRTGPR